MRASNIVTEAGLQTRLSQWWNGIPFSTSMIVITCGLIYIICLLFGYDTFHEICFIPSAILSNFQVYRMYSSIFFHGTLLHVMFNMLALIPLGCEIERTMGSIRLLFLTFLLATVNSILHIAIAFVASVNPIHPFPSLVNECSIGFSGVLFSMIVIETSLTGAQTRSVFGLFNVPANWYALLLLVVIQLLMPNVSLLGHLCGIISGFAYVYGYLNILIPGSSFFSSIEGSSSLSTCVGRPKFILSSGGSPTSYIPSFTRQNSNTSPRALFSHDTWRNMTSWLPRSNSPTQPAEENRFPGRSRTLGGQTRVQSSSAENDVSSLQDRLLNTENATQTSVPAARETVPTISSTQDNAPVKSPPISNEQVTKLMAMGFEKTQVEVALAASDGNLDVAVEILMSQLS